MLTRRHLAAAAAAGALVAAGVTATVLRTAGSPGPALAPNGRPYCPSGWGKPGYAGPLPCVFRPR